MRILLAMRSVEQAEGGPITAAAGLTRALVARGHTVQITAHDDGVGDAVTRVFPSDLTVRLFPRTSRTWEYSREYAKWLSRNVKNYDLVIINSLWISHVHFASRAARKYSVPYVVRPHGCLNPADMDHKRAMKRVYWKLEDRRNCRRALFIHSTSAQETGFVEAAGLGNVETIPLGIDSAEFQFDRSQVDRKTILFVGRIAQKKGVDILIRALAAPALANQGYRLNVLGVDHRGLQAGLEELAEELGVKDRVQFVGHADESLRAEYLARSGVFALPSTDENFGLAVAEAMASTLPVVVTPGVSHAAMLAERSAGIVVERDVDAVAAAIRRVGEMSTQDYETLGRRGRRAVEDLFGWDVVAEQLESAVHARLQHDSSARESTSTAG